MRTLGFLIAVVGFGFSVGAHASSTKLGFALPGAEGQFIRNVRARDNVVVVYHTMGVSVSGDRGRTFAEAYFPNASTLRFADQDHAPLIHIGEERILVGVNGTAFISDDMGATFVEGGELGPRGHLRSIQSAAFSGNDIVVAPQFEFGHDTCDMNVLMISRDGGHSFVRRVLGDNDCTPFGWAIFHAGMLYANQGRASEVFRSADQGGTFEIIASNDSGWLAARAEAQRTADAVTHVFNRLDFPNARLHEECASLMRIDYENPRFDASGPSPGIAYEYTKNGRTQVMSSALIPRFGAVDASRNALYFASFKEVWVMQIP